MGFGAWTLDWDLKKCHHESKDLWNMVRSHLELNKSLLVGGGWRMSGWVSDNANLPVQGGRLIYLPQLFVKFFSLKENINP